MKQQLTDATKRNGFVALVRSVETFDLLRDPNAFALLALIALRARWHGVRNDGVQPGQMLLGRESAARELGLKQGATREATKRLISAGYITTKATNRGTLVTLIDSMVFDIGSNGDSQRTASRTATAQPTDSQPTATNKEGEGYKTDKRTGVMVDFPSSLDSPDFRSAWDLWIQYRCERKLRPWTAATVAAKLRELADMGEAEAVAAIRASIGNGWQSIYPPKAQTNKPTKPLFR